MRVLICPDKFKDCLSAEAAAAAMAAGFGRVSGMTLRRLPLADGGEGTTAALVGGGAGTVRFYRVTGPLPEMKVDAAVGYLDGGTTAVIEVAAASGLHLLSPADRDPLATTTFGTGELIRHAVAAGVKKIVLGLGGSATVDGGIGCLQACGFTILTRDGEPTSPTEPLTGRDVGNVLMVKHGRGEVTAGVEIVGAADVGNVLLGPGGAAAVFGPQKGASQAAVGLLESKLTSLAATAPGHADRPRAGAAGGLGFAVSAFFRGPLVGGFELVAAAVNLQAAVVSADLVVTGEGRLDAQTGGGKVVAGVAGMCQANRVPCVALVGRFDGTLPPGLTAAFAAADGPMPLAESLARADVLLAKAAHQCGRLFAAGRGPGEKMTDNEERG